MATRPTIKLPSDRLLPRFTLSLFGKPKLTALIWLVLVIFGAVSYTVLLKHEGFPSINIPIAMVNGVYPVDDPAKVDKEVAKPLVDLVLKDKNASTVQSQSSGNFYMVLAQYKEGTDIHKTIATLNDDAKIKLHLPASVAPNFQTVQFGINCNISVKTDDLIALYKQGNASTATLTATAQTAVSYLNAHKPSLVKNFYVCDPYQSATDPLTGEQTKLQRSFDRFGIRQQNQNRYFNSVAIGVSGVDTVDVIELDEQLKPLLDQLGRQPHMRGYATTISASNAPQIHDEISELQRVLLEGLVAVLVIGSIVIALRASVITVLAMVTVILTTLGLLYLIHYSLNVITLFALILGLSLIVDDTIIMTEAIEASRRTEATARDAVRLAVRKISRAMVAATLTATLSFAPLLFVGGILGSFIRAIPVTIIAALLISLLVALIFIPLFARFLLLGKGQLGRQRRARSVATRIEAAIARAICGPMLWARGSTKKLLSVGIIAVVLSLLFVAAAGMIFSKVTFNIFPPTKDTNQLSVSLAFPPGTTIEQAEHIADQADKLIADTLGDNFVNASYYGTGSASQAISYINIISYGKRDVTSPELVKQLQGRFDHSFKPAQAQVGQVDVGPPSSAFTVEIRTEDRAKGYRLANDIRNYFHKTTLTRVSGTTAHFTNTNVSSPDQFVRNNGKLSINVTANFDADDTTTLVTLGQAAVKKEFTADKLASYGLPANAIAFNIGQESENQSSFNSLAIAFPIMLLVIYLLLAIEFKSLLQPLFIFMAIPFSLFGVTLGLYLTHNAFSFFAALGFFALIGLSLKNTILLTDYANQSRRNGLGAIDSAVAALSERFRPLVATSLTAVVSLIPLALTSPFWQGLAVVLIFGLLSSTLLVILVFPYYYLGGEFLRARISRKTFLTYAAVAIGLALLLTFISELLFK